jgi:hypothetical protein
VDKAFWQEIVDNHYKLPEKLAVMPLTEELLNYLGEADRDLRDKYAYEILARWLVLYRYHEPDQMREMLQWLLEQLYVGLGEEDTDTVFLRSNAAAVLALIMYRNDREHFLDEIEVSAILDKAKSYLIEERDTRAYVENMGWANAIANAASLLRYIAFNQNLSPSELQGILDTLTNKLMQPVNMPFAHDEEDRLAKIVLAILTRDALTSFDFVDWVKCFSEWKTEHQENGVYNAVYNHTYQNIKHFLRALYTHMDLTIRLPYSAQEFKPDLLEVLRDFSL